jgi:hypothetical protein
VGGLSTGGHVRRLSIARVAVLILCLAASLLVYTEPASAAPAGGPDGWRTIHNAFSGKCMDDYGFSTANGNQIVQWDCNGLTNQRWTWYWSGGHIAVRNVFSGKCLDDYGFSTANGGPIVQWDCNGLDNQKWDFPYA